MSQEVFFYPETRFGGFSDVDGTIAFFSRINALLDPSFTVLDVGCGRGEYQEDPVTFRRDLRILKGKAARVVGIDVDEAGETNPYIDEFRRIEGSLWPVDTSSIDLIVCDNVLEHLEAPDAFFSEARRVLKNDGLLAIRTTNRLGYAALIAQLIPNRLHARVIGKVQKGRKAEDVFPTVYRCNTVWTLRQTMKKYGFDHAVYGYEAEPVYLSFSRITYFMGKLYGRIAPGSLKHALFAFGRLSKANDDPH